MLPKLGVDQPIIQSCSRRWRGIGRFLQRARARPTAQTCLSEGMRYPMALALVALSLSLSRSRSRSPSSLPIRVCTLDGLTRPLTLAPPLPSLLLAPALALALSRYRPARWRACGTRWRPARSLRSQSPPPLPRTRAHARTRAQIHARTRARAHAHTFTRTRTHAHAHTGTRVHVYVRNMHARARAGTGTGTGTGTRTHTHTLKGTQRARHALPHRTSAQMRSGIDCNRRRTAFPSPSLPASVSACREGVRVVVAVARNEA